MGEDAATSAIRWLVSRHFGTTQRGSRKPIRVGENLIVIFMKIYRLKIERNRICKLTRLSMSKILSIFLLGMLLGSCATYNNYNPKDYEDMVISSMTTIQTRLTKVDVAKFFCSTLTEYFNTYKYYKISSEVYTAKEKQSLNSTTRVLKRGNIYNVEYIGSSGRYVISFSDRYFSNAEEITLFTSRTVGGNRIRGQVYDTFTAWVSKMEIALKANFDSYLYMYYEELKVAVEVENWHNLLSGGNND